MTHAAPPLPLFCLQLQPGRRVWEYLPRAADITVTEGSIVIHQRLILAGEWVHLPVLVQAGELFCVAAGGWVEMEATTPTQIQAHGALAWWRMDRMWGGLRRAVSARTRSLQSKQPQAA